MRFPISFLKKEFIIAGLISILFYIIFFHSLWIPGNLIWGSDLEYKHFPSRWYLFQQIIEYGRFPFWTEKMFGGFPIYADSELGYLNPLNIASLLLFGPALSIKVLHLISYLIGSFSLFHLAKRNGYGLLSFALSNTIFFGSFFMINHLIHLNLIMIAYLLPLHVLLFDYIYKYILDKNWKKTLLFSILLSVLFAYGFLWGHYQTSLFALISICLFIVSKIEFKNLRMSFLSFVILGLIGAYSVVLSLPQTYPTYDLYVKSERIKSDDINLFEGSYTPSLFVLLMYPQIWGDFDTFYGKTFNGDYSYTEFYNYLGISVLLFSILLFIFTKFNFLSRNLLLSFYVFVFFGFIAFMPFITPDFPGLSGFRYWVRSVIILIFGISLFSMKIEDLLKLNISQLKKNISEYFWKTLLLFSPLLYLLIANFLNPNNVFNYDFFKNNYYKNLLISQMGLTLIAISISVSVLFFVFLFVKNYKFRITILVAIILVVFTDLRIFASDGLDARIDKINIPSKISFDESLKNTRILINESDAVGQRALYHDYWSPFGYSQYSPNKYVDKFTDIEVDLTSSRGEGFEDFQYIDELYELGVLGLYDNGKYYSSDKLPDIHYVKQGDFLGENIISKENGVYSFSIDSNTEQTINTFIKNDSDMKITVNGERFITNPKDTFILLKVNNGLNVINIEYIPSKFYLGTLISLISLLVITMFYRFYKWN